MYFSCSCLLGVVSEIMNEETRWRDMCSLVLIMSILKYLLEDIYCTYNLRKIVSDMRLFIFDFLPFSFWNRCDLEKIITVFVSIYTRCKSTWNPILLIMVCGPSTPLPSSPPLLVRLTGGTEADRQHIRMHSIAVVSQAGQRSSGVLTLQ